RHVLTFLTPLLPSPTSTLFPYTTLFRSLDALADEVAHRAPDRRHIERHPHLPVSRDALAHAYPPAPRHQRVGVLQEQIVDVVALLFAHLQRVAESCRGEQRGGRALAFDEGVGHQGGGMDEDGD